MKKTTVLLIAAVVLSFSANAAAPSRIDDVSVKVSFEDLDIDNEAGARVLYSRLRDAAEQVCDLDSFLELRSLATAAKRKECYQEALDKAIAEIDHEQLSRIHKS